jgi:hypothetical protein
MTKNNMVLVKLKKTAEIYKITSDKKDIVLLMTLSNLINPEELPLYGLSYSKNLSENSKFRKCFFNGNWFYISSKDLAVIKK